MSCRSDTERLPSTDEKSDRDSEVCMRTVDSAQCNGAGGNGAAVTSNYGL